MAASNKLPYMGADELPFGSDEPFEVFQDSFNPIEYNATISNTAPMPDLTMNKNPRRPLGSMTSNAFLKPQPAQMFLPSPSKMRNTSQPFASLSPTQGHKLYGKMHMPPPWQVPQTDSLKKKPFLSNFKTRPKKSSIDSTTQWISQSPIFPPPPKRSMSENHITNQNGKRELLEAAPLTSEASNSFDDANSAQDQPPIPSWDSFPPIIDDGLKPNHSYAQMIAMAILRSPSGKLTLSSIYKWISDNYSFYNPNDPGWQNSIRHNLSLHKSFRKIVRPKSDPGKGNYWAIEPGAEHQFLKEKPKGKSTPSGENLPVMSTRLEPSMPMVNLTSEPTLPPPAPITHCAQPTPAYNQMLSSDATIPEIDSGLPEEFHEITGEADNSDAPPYSPTQGVTSSPPMSRHSNPAEGTPCTGRAQSRTRKATEAGMDDSGYISSLDSSALRTNKTTIGWTSTERPRKKRKTGPSGRAEVEIARLRKSSPFSPTKGRSRSGYPPVSSSPLRMSAAIINPLTPPVKMKPPVMAPPSVSPTTNLRNHRRSVQNLLKTPAAKLLEDEVGNWSPKFDLDKEGLSKTYDVSNTDFWIGNEENLWTFTEDQSAETADYTDGLIDYGY